MGRSKVSAWGWQSRELNITVSPFSAKIPRYQIRTCARCGHHTTFVLEDAAGGWYSCIECGRYG
jgi:PHP family Zn ribbon phosphoesterase